MQPPRESFSAKIETDEMALESKLKTNAKYAQDDFARRYILINNLCSFLILFDSSLSLFFNPD